MNNEPQQPTDHEDRLVDRGLDELVGGDAPPDLSERILAAASQQPLATPVTGDPAMNETRNTLTSKRRRWAFFGAAAGLLIAVGVVIAMRQMDETQLAKVAPPSESSPKSEDSIGLQGLINDDYASQEAAEGSRQRSEPQEVLEESFAKEEFRGAGQRFRIDASPGSKLDRFSEPVIRSPHSARGVIASGSGGLPHAVHSMGQAKRKSLDAVARVQDTSQYFGSVSPGRRPPASAPLSATEGIGPGNSGDQYTRINENPFIEAQGGNAVSTFSIDVDTASYANVRQFLMQSNQLPLPDAVRIEELVNYFDYDYSGLTDEVPFAAHVETAGCPWHPEHRLVRIGIKGHEIERTRRPQSNLVFLIDVSGSMNQPAKLPLLVEGMKMLTRELGENDRVAIVVYASSEGLALPSTSGDKQATILAALEQLRAGGSTAGGAGIELAYQTAQDNFIEGGTNRVILCTDGDFNVGVTSTSELERMAENNAKESGIFLTVLGFGRGNLNDAMMEAISGKGNGNYHYVDNRTEARKVLVEEMAGTLVTIAKDVKIQVEFNPSQVAGYRLLGYENRMLRTEDFNDDKKDAGEIGAGHTVTALYQVVPAGKSVDVPDADPLKYQQAAKPASEVPASGEMLTLKIRYKKPDGDSSTKLEFPITDTGGSFAEATDDFQFAAAVASFGMLLRDSEHRGNTSYAAVLEIAEGGMGRDLHEYRVEFLQLVKRARKLAGE